MVKITFSQVTDTLNVVAVIPGGSLGGQGIVAQETKEVSIPQTPENFIYDSDGNLASDGKWIYSWSGENNLIAMETISSIPDNKKTKLVFSYDSDGRRISKKVYSWNSQLLNWELSIQRHFVHAAGFNLLAETDSLQNLKTSFVWGTDLSGCFDGAGGVGGLLWSISGSGINYYSYDFNGNVSNLINSSGTVTASYEYDPFGNIIKSAGANAAENKFKFSIKYLDAETNLSYYGYRYYSADKGRWINRDPIEEDGGLNLYVLVGNQQLLLIDLLGLRQYTFEEPYKRLTTPNDKRAQAALARRDGSIGKLVVVLEAKCDENINRLIIV